MKNSDIRISYITEYITSYEAKIKALNKNGLFDSAKLFELFAIETCKLWFNQNFINLNDDNLNYPYVDLVSEDGENFVQVSTEQNIPNKIKNTLEKIKNNKSKNAEKIKSVYFFVLNNNSIKNVKDYSDNEKIGNLEFKKADNLITTQDIINRAQNDLDFQIALYNLLQKEDASITELSNKLILEIKNSKEIGLNSIDCFINDEYEIDRKEIIEKIRSSKNQFLSVRGEAGCGKSVICKKYVENEPYLLFARAERFFEESDINDIWHLNLSNTLKFLHDKPIYFFIDSLEFIADAPKTKLDLLQSLYELIKEYPNAKIITSCRNSEQEAFIKLDSKYCVETFSVDNLSMSELIKISKNYPIIKSFLNDFKYSDLVRSPFYINLIIKNITDASNISDENKLRDFIWENVICLCEKSKKYNVQYNDVVKEIKHIVFNRSKLFLLGINKGDLNQNILKALLSEGVLIENGNTVRLKYDIFEDICFEKEIDNIFTECRAEYNNLFCKIEEFGRCCYRRYQIWISNKLFTKTNRDKFIYKLIFSENLQSKWFEQTVIGIVKSKFCSDFFKDQTNNIIKHNLINCFVDITNLHAFESKVLYLTTGQRLLLQPNGNGRPEIIKIIYENKLYETQNIDTDAIIKLCSDYAISFDHDSIIEDFACLILEYFIETELKNANTPYHIYKRINLLLDPIYLMSESAHDWINSFWEIQTSNFLSNDRKSTNLTAKIFEHTLKHAPNSLAKTHANELCNLANTFWTTQLNDNSSLYENRFDEISYCYGLSEYAENYQHSRDSLTENTFFTNLLKQNFGIGLNWMINFTNQAVLNYVNNENADFKEITLHFSKNKKYYANSEMWLSGSQECHFPTLIGDMVYILKSTIIDIIDILIKSKDNYKLFANRIKEAFLQNSNNIIFFSIIEDIGLHFEKEIPGFALELATSMDIIYWDINRYASLNPPPESKMLKNNIFAILGVPYIKDRYEDNSAMNFTLQEYVSHMQFYDETKEYCYKVLDYLYSIFPNDKENALEHLQIQKMDLRNATVEIIDSKTAALSPAITGNAKKVVEANAINNNARTSIEKMLKDFFDNFDPNNYDLNDVLKCIEDYQLQIKNVNMPFSYQEYYLILISYALNKENLESSKRNDFCDFWINGVNSILKDETFSFKYALLFVLFRQIDSNADIEIKNRIKLLIFNIIIYKGNNSLISKLKQVTRKFLKANQSLGKTVFNTIIMISEDEMEYQKYNYKCISELEKASKQKFISNLTPEIFNADERILRAGKKQYKKNSDKIINKYLFCEEKPNTKDLSINSLDINTLYCIVDCGLSVKDQEVAFLIHEMINCLINVWNSKDYKYDSINNINYMVEYEISDYLGNEIFESQNQTLNILFTNIHFSKFTKNATDFYIRIFGSLLPKYVDVYGDFATRRQCEDILTSLEEKINTHIKDQRVKYDLYRSLILSVSGYESDWSKVKTDYSYDDIQFLNQMFSKYGKFNFKYFIYTLYKMKFEKLLPNILPSVAATLKEFSSNEFFDLSELNDTKKILEYLIVLAFLDFNDEIKQDEELTESYESILETLIGLKFEKAAVLLDEFKTF